jgi:HD-like signal output (HDOD) protein
VTTGLGRKPTDADYGLGEHNLDADKLGLMEERELTERLVRTFKKPSYSPPRLPAVAMEIMALSRKSEVEFKEVESLLERDPVLAGEVLSIARSVHFSGIRPVRTLGAALVRIGLATLRTVVMQAALEMRVFRSEEYGGCMERLRRHSLATAHLSRLLSRYTPVSQDRAFLCGLMHDVGVAGILLVLGEVEQGKKAPDLAVLWPAIDGAHAVAGSRMVELWRLPRETSAAVAGHHRGRVAGIDDPMAATVCLAEAYSARCDFGLIPRDQEQREKAGLPLHDGIDRSSPEVLERARQVVDLTDDKLQRFLAEAEELAEKIEL